MSTVLAQLPSHPPPLAHLQLAGSLPVASAAFTAPPAPWDSLRLPAAHGGGSSPNERLRLASDDGPPLVASGLSAPESMSTTASPITTTFAQKHLILQQPPTQPYNREFPPPLAPRHWTVLKEVGDGSFGTVWLADWHSPLNLPPGTQPPGPSSRPEYKGKQLVAIKRMKKAFEGGWDECMKLKELKSLRQIPMHPNIIPLYDAFLLPSSRELYFVFECMEGNLYQLTKSRKGRPLASGLTASIFYQILAGLNHCHVHGYFHRDLKPENLLITTTGLADYPASSLYALPGTPPEKDVVVVVKLADFGLAREITSKPPYTEYVSTRWYRAPEVLLRSRDYSVPVDMWALGTILVEVLTLKPLFPGDSEVDQVYKICEVLGDPSTDYGADERGRLRGGGTWPRGVRMAKDVGFAFPKIPPRNFAALFDQNVVPIQLIDCIADLLRYEPKARLTTQQCLDHAYFREVAYRFTPFAPPQTHQQQPQQQLPTPSSSQSTVGPYGSSLSVHTSGLPNPPSQASPRNIPPSHSHSAQAAAFKLPYPADPNGQALPSPDHFARQPGHPSAPPARNFSISSGASGGSLASFQVPIQAAHPGAGDQPMLSFPSPAPSSVHSGQGGESNWGQLPGQAGATNGGLRPMPGFAGPARRGSLAPSLAPSTYYDGSIYEGMAPSKASSVMSFPVSYGGGAESTYNGFPALSPQQSRVDSIASAPVAGPSGLGVYAGSPPLPSSASPQPHQLYQQQQQQASQPDLASSPQSTKSSTRGWGLNPLKRSPSNASISGAASIAPSVATSSLDPKKAKKEAERLAKEQEKANRLAKEQAARERARAVMKKKNQLMEAADPLHNFSNLSRNSATGGASPAAADKGKGRAMPSDRVVQQRMPQIIEDTSRLHVSPQIGNGASFDGASINGGSGSATGSFLANRFKARRRNDDDDVHSVSSSETGASSQHWPFPVGSGRGRPFSISSKATSASDPEQRRHRLTDFPTVEMDPLARVSSISSLPATGQRAGGAGGSLHRFPSYGHYTAPSTGHSSLDANFISNMQGLATTAHSELHLPGLNPSSASIRSESRTRLASPRDAHHPPHPHHERYSPYQLPTAHAPRSPGPTLPPISSFDQAQQQFLRRGSTAASIASHQSQPGVMPSYFVNPPGSEGGGQPGMTYHLPHVPAMDQDPPPAGQGDLASPISATFPYPSPSLSVADGNGVNPMLDVQHQMAQQQQQQQQHYMSTG
ncbi:hypothetical protein JCM10207_005264 [Rhodosporidiobolus poonsookiae]